MMSVKLNTESMAGQMLNMAANQATGKGNSNEDFEQMLWQMSTAQDELVMSTGQSNQKPQNSQNTQKPQSSQGSQTTQKNDGSQKQQGSQKTDGDKVSQGAQGTQNSQTQATEPAEESVAEALAAMLMQNVQPVILNFAEEQAAGEMQTVNGSVVEAFAAADMTGAQGTVQQNMQQTAGELAGDLTQGTQGEHTELVGQFAQAMNQSGQSQADGQQLGAEVAAKGGNGGDAAAKDEPEAEVLTAADSQMFGELDAAPVKVAEVKQQTPVVQPEAANAADQIAQQIQQALQSGDTAVRINLTPANLGSLTVEISRLSDGTLSVILSTVTEKAANLLGKHSTSLQTLLMNNTQGQVRVEVENRMDEQPTQQFLNPEGENNAKEQQHQQQRQQQEQTAPEDFLQQLRLGLVNIDQAN